MVSPSPMAVFSIFPLPSTQVIKRNPGYEKLPFPFTIKRFATYYVSEWLFGNKARNREEFKRMVEDKDWENLFSKIKVKDGDFVHTPAGVIHGGYGKGTVSATFRSFRYFPYSYQYENNQSIPCLPR